MRMRAVLTVTVALWALVLGAGVVAGQEARQRIALIELDGELREQARAMPGLLGAGGPPLLRDVQRTLRTAGGGEYAGVVIRLKDFQASPSQIDELGRVLREIRDAGRRVHVYAENYGTGELLLAAQADEVIIQRGGAVSIPGMLMQEMYLADTLAWLGMSADFVQIGDYKGASEPFARSAPSPEWDRNINGLLDALYGHMRTVLRTGRGLDEAGIDRALAEAWMCTGDQARALGLVDTVLDLPELTDHLEASYGGRIAWSRDLMTAGSREALDPSNPFALLQALMRPSSYEPTRPTIAVLHIEGSIVDGESQPAGLMGGSSVGSRTIRKALQAIEESPLIKGVVVRVNSPGGSAIASEVMWQGLRRVATTKPVWVSVGSMAASGGYYVAVAGERIYVTPASIVGSIGVVGGKIVMGGLFDKARLHVVERARGPRASMAATTARWSEEERALVRARMQETYELFAGRVAAGRPGIDLTRTAEGRLFAGEDAVGLRMADEVGGLDDAVRDLASRLALAGGSYDVMDYPAPKTLPELIEEIMKGFGVQAPAVAAQGAGVEALRAVLGEDTSAMLGAGAEALLQLRREPVLLVSPRGFVIR